MATELLKAAYSPDGFKKNGQLILQTLVTRLQDNLQGETERVIGYQPPEKSYAFWKEMLESQEDNDWLPKLLEQTTQVHHPRYMGHQISPTAPITALTSLVSAFLNNGMGVYEMGMAPTAMEKVVVEWLCQKIGYDDTSGGFLTSGGTLANLTALLSARRRVAAANVWEEGTQNRLAIMVSEEAHYCVDRAARVMGLGTEGIIKIPVDGNYRMDTRRLQSAYDKAVEAGLEVFAIVGSAPTTATGIYDDLLAISEFAKKAGIWFHVDAAHGGPACFAPAYRHLVLGIEKADSIVIDGHKMMMMPAVTTALLFKDGGDSHRTFSQKATYLLEEQEGEDWYNLAKRTFECTKYMMSLHWFVLIQQYGDALFSEFVTTLYDAGRNFAKILEEEPDFEIAITPMSNIVCFRYTGCVAANLNQLNRQIRHKLLEEGTYYVVQTSLKEGYFLRATLMNPFTTQGDLRRLLVRIREIAGELS